MYVANATSPDPNAGRGTVDVINTAGAIAGGFFRVSNSDDGTGSIDQSVISDNRVTPNGDGNAGGMYLQGLALRITASTIAVVPVCSALAKI